jgi:excisionase family DNA binding protein
MPRIHEDLSQERIAISVKEAMALTGLGRNSFYKLINSGQLASVKIGQRRVVKLASLRDLLDAPQVPGPVVDKPRPKYGRSSKTAPSDLEAV